PAGMPDCPPAQLRGAGYSLRRPVHDGRGRALVGARIARPHSLTATQDTQDDGRWTMDDGRWMGHL
ncbi:MAG: hypothetical protein RSG55_07745, partial [Oscillospiraceae bacterium]